MTETPSIETLHLLEHFQRRYWPNGSELNSYDYLITYVSQPPYEGFDLVFRPRPAGFLGEFLLTDASKETKSAGRPRRRPPAAGPLCFSVRPAVAQTHALRLHSRASCAGAQTALAFPAALRSDSRSLKSARPCDARRLPGLERPKALQPEDLYHYLEPWSGHGLVFLNHQSPPTPIAVDAAEKRKPGRI